MSRPEFPNCVMTAEIIERIRSNQEFYDKDPEGYERREREAEKRRREEQEEKRRAAEEEQ